MAGSREPSAAGIFVFGEDVAGSVWNGTKHLRGSSLGNALEWTPCTVMTAPAGSFCPPQLRGEGSHST